MPKLVIHVTTDDGDEVKVGYDGSLGSVEFDDTGLVAGDGQIATIAVQDGEVFLYDNNGRRVSLIEVFVVESR